MAPDAKLVKPAALMRLRTRQLASAPWRSLYQYPRPLRVRDWARLPRARQVRVARG